MPLLETSSYKSRSWLNSGHLQTILPALFRRIPLLPPSQRVRLETPDQDFLDADWWRQGSDRLAILSHGLEGSSRAGYIQGMAAVLLLEGWDVVAWNFRGCSGEMNRRARFYHSGETGDLATVISYFKIGYDSTSLIGFSLGGNVTLKYLGEAPSLVDPAINAAVVFSVPCDLGASARRLDQPQNRIYTRRFLRSLRKKVVRKARRHPGLIDATGVERIRSFRDFDDRYTAPIHGFRDAVDYWERSSSRQFLTDIRVPALLVNAWNDPFLPPACFPIDEAKSSRCFYLETPSLGGHLGFSWPNGFWPGVRAAAFLARAEKTVNPA